MAGKNTAVFGIYPEYASVENGVDALKAAGFRNTDISVLFPENVGTKDFAHKKETKAPEGTATGGNYRSRYRRRSGLARWASARWPSLASGLSSPPARSWPLWLESESAAQSAASPEL